MPKIESAYLTGLHEKLKTQIDRAETLFGDLNSEQLNWKPSPKQWSVGEGLEHLHITIGFYCTNLGNALEEARKRGDSSSGSTKVKHTLPGRMLLMGVNPTGKMKVKTFKAFEFQGSEVATDILERFTASHNTFLDLMTQCNGLDLNRIKISSPISGLIRLNANDAFEINTGHAERHINQAERVTQTAGFPDSA